LIRPDYQKEEDRGDWRTLDLARFDFRSLEGPIRIIKKALQRNPELKLYASLYSPPPWMKSNGATSGQGTLKEGLHYRRHLARYLFAYLKYAQSQGLTVHYLGFFNEPDWPHTQDGMHFSDLGMLAETFADCAASLNSLIAADGTLKPRPIYVFPDTLGPGSLTRAGAGTL
jgi:O-glycosyl hydrolase